MKEKYSIAFLIPILSNTALVENHIFFKKTLKSICNLYNTSKKYNIVFTIYVGFDSNDILLSDNIKKSKFIKHSYKLGLPSEVKLKFYCVNNKNGNPVKGWNILFKNAYYDNNDYFFQTGDDITLINDNMILNYISFFEKNNNIGLCGPLDLTYPNVFTQSFVSRIHFEIFENYFDSIYKNWYCDNWLSSIYPKEKIYDYGFCLNRLTKPRYEIHNLNLKLHEFRICEGKNKIKKYMNKLPNIIEKPKDNKTSLLEQRRKDIINRKDEIKKNIYNQRIRYLFSVVCVTNKINNLNNIISNYSRQKNNSKELIIIFNDIQNTNEVISSILEKISFPIRFYNLNNLTLGECLNYGVKQMYGDYFVKFDDDDFYSENYLEEALLYINKTRAKILGKGVCTIYIPEKDKFYIRSESKENSYCRKIYGGTIICKKNIILKYPFPSLNLGEDSEWLKLVLYNNHQIYATSCENYTYIRSIDNSNHTWKININDFLKSCLEIKQKKEVKKYFSK